MRRARPLRRRPASRRARRGACSPASRTVPFGPSRAAASVNARPTDETAVVPDRVESGLHAGLRARDEVIADLLLRKVFRAARRLIVRVRRVQRGRAGPDRPVDHEVAAERVRTARQRAPRSPRPPTRRGGRGSRAPDTGAGSASSAGQVGTPCTRRRPRTRGPRRCPARRPDAGTRAARHGAAVRTAANARRRVPAACASRVTGAESTPPGPAGQRRHDSGQRRAHLRGVHVDPGDVRRPVADHRVQLRPGRRPVLRPPRLLPAVRPQQPRARASRSPDQVQALGAATRAAERSRPVMASPRPSCARARRRIPGRPARRRGRSPGRGFPPPRPRAPRRSR